MTNRLRWRRWLRYGVYLGMLGLLATAFFPTPVGGRTGTAQEANLCRSKLSRLWTATQTAAEQAAKADAAFTERELNAHLASILENNPKAREARGFNVSIEQLSVVTDQGQARLFVAGRLARLPFVLEYRAISTSGPAAGRCRSVRLGRLPLLPPLKWMALRQLKRLAGGLRMEKEVLRHLSALTVEEGSVRVEIKTPIGSGLSS